MREFGASDRGLLAQMLRSGRLSRFKDGLVRRSVPASPPASALSTGIPRNSNMTGLSQVLAVAGMGPEHTVLCDPLVQYSGIAAVPDLDLLLRASLPGIVAGQSAAQSGDRLSVPDHRSW